MLRAVLVCLAIVATALPAGFGFAAAHERDASSSQMPPIPWTQTGFDEAALPEGSGWFLVPVTVDRPAYVRFASDVFAGNDPSMQTAWATLLVVEQAEPWGIPPILGSGTAGSQPIASASSEGGTLTCCAQMWASYAWTWGDGPEVALPLQPGQVAWFGLAALEWGEWDDAYFDVSGQALITLGEPRTGERVEAVDLYDAALKQGTNVRLLGSDLVTLPADVERTFESEGFGVFLVEAWSWGSTATLTLEVPGEAPRSVELGADTSAYAAAHRAGTYRVALADLEKAPSGVGADDGLWARAFFVDIDVPGDAAYIYTWPEG